MIVTQVMGQQKTTLTTVFSMLSLVNFVWKKCKFVKVIINFHTLCMTHFEYTELAY